ncbi:MAG: hypothetical protein AABX47_08410 [Nanoarchaeota archaeon]
MPELNPAVFESIFFRHIKALTLNRPDPDKVQLRLQSFDYQFSDRWINHQAR